jgi:hypothetical protein
LACFISLLAQIGIWTKLLNFLEELL